MTGHLPDITSFADPSTWTGTQEVGSVLSAPRTVFTRLAGTPIHHCITLLASESLGTVTDEKALPVLACGPILARISVTHIDPGLAVVANEPMWTATTVAVDAINAGASIHTRTAGAVVVVGFTVATRESKRAGASV